MNRTEFLKDSYFLKQIDTLSVKQQYLKLTILDWNEQPLNEIQGKAISGSLNIDGRSSLRRTANFTMFAQEDKNDLTAINQELSINRKVKLEIGILNTVPDYTYQVYDEVSGKTNFYTINYQEKYGDIVWFPLGIYVIFDPNISHSLSGVTISITLKDKMCLLNGDAGGVIPATVNFSQIEDEYGAITIPTMRQTIYQLVNHFGLQDAAKIVIDDLQDRIKQVVRYVGNSPVYFYKDNEGTYQISYTQPDDSIDYKIWQYGADVGFILTDFVYPGTLECDGGATVTSVLDNIIAALGNYEYFYDVEGNFHFQQIKNYLNTTYTTTITTDGTNLYEADLTSGKSIYSFDDTKLITDISNSPKYSNVKNDFVVWGVRKNSLGVEIPIRYHLAIDKKPEKVYNEQSGTWQYSTHWANLYLDEDGNWRAAADFFFLAQSGSIVPTRKVEPDTYYILNSEILYKYQKILVQPTNDSPYYKYSWEVQTPLENTIWQTQDGKRYMKSTSDSEKLMVIDNITISQILHTPKDWREQLYYQGIQALATGSDYPYYFTQLLNEWPKLYNLREQKFNDSVLESPGQVDYWLDFIEQSSEVGQYSVNNIGRRSTIVIQDELNCVFENEIPDIVYINLGQTPDEINKLRDECVARGQQYYQMSSDLYALLQMGGNQNSCYQRITQLLYQYTNMNETIQISAIPIFYLEPNTRITVRDDASGVIGDYMIDSISLPLDINSVMSLSCYKCLTKI